MVCLYTEKDQSTQYVIYDLNYIYEYIFIFKEKIKSKYGSIKWEKKVKSKCAINIYAHLVHLQFYKSFPFVLIHRNISNT